MPPSAVIEEELRYSNGLPVYFAKEGGGHRLLAGFSSVGSTITSRLARPLGSCSADVARSKAELTGRSVFGVEPEAILVRVCSVDCLSISGSGSFLGKKLQIDEPLDPLRLACSGEFGLETQTPSTSTPLSIALMPKGISSARGTPPLLRSLICRCRACSFLSFSATAEYLRSLQWL